MKEKIVAVVNSHTFRNTGVVASATIINGILGFVFFWVMARFFNATVLGSFTIAVTAAGLITDATTFGVETGIVNFVGKFISTDYKKALKFLKLALDIKIITALLIIILGWFIAPFIASTFLQKGNLTVVFRFALFAAATSLLFGFVTSSLQALQKFVVWGLVNILSNTVRLLVVVGLFVLGILTINSSLVVYVFIPLLSFSIAFFYIPNFFKVKGEKEVFPEFFRYSKWVAIFTLIGATAARVDVFMIARLGTLKDVGIYSVASTLTSVISQIVAAIGTVVAPKLARVKTKELAKIYLRKLQMFIAGLALGGIVFGIVVGYFFIRDFYKPEYFSSFVPFIFLLIGQAIFLFSIPVHMSVIYYFSYPKLFVTISVVNIFIVIILCLILIPILGITGAAISVLVGNISNFVIPLVWVLGKFRE